MHLRYAIAILLFTAGLPAIAQIDVRSDATSGQLGLWSVQDSAWVVDPVFARVDPLTLHADAGRPTPGRYVLETAGRVGVYDSQTNRWIIPPNYKSLDTGQSLAEAYLVSNGRGRYGLVAPGGRDILPAINEAIHYLGRGVWEVELKGKRGRFNAEGRQVGEWAWIKPVSLGGKTYYESRSGGKLGLYDERGNEMLPHDFRYLSDYAGGIRARKYDGRVGLLRRDLSVEVPFDYTDIQRVVTGLNPAEDYLLLARRSPRGLYAIINRRGEPESDFVFSFNEELRVYRDAVIDVPRPAQIFIRNRRGEPIIAESFNMVRPFPVLSEAGIPVLAVRKAGSHLLALANVDKGRVVTEFKYGELNRVSPVVEPRRYLPLIEGHTRRGIELLRPDGRRLSDWYFLGVEDYNNWKSLREYFQLPDDPTAEALAWTSDLKVFVVHNDDRVVYIGQYQAE